MTDMPGRKTAVSGRLELPLLWTIGMAATVFLIARKVEGAPEYGRVFNVMLERLLHGQVDMPASVIGGEAFVYKGRTYAYFGLFCALLRAPLLLFGRMDLDVTKASMIVAAGLSLGARLCAMRLALLRAEGLTRELRLLLLIFTAFAGESLQYLRPSIYQEVCSWGAALAALFVLLAVRRLVGARPRVVLLYAGMAVTAGLALLCRVSFGVGLYTALGLMLAVEAWRGRLRPATLKALAPAALILALFLGVAGAINQARWDNPLAFVPIRYQLGQQQQAPDRVERLRRYGETSVLRIPFALQYYFTPVWELQDGAGRLLFQQIQLDLFDSVELPPASFFLSDPIAYLLAALGVFTLVRRRTRAPEPALAGAALLGLALPAGVMLMAISLTYRYRMDFYPALDFAALIGAASLRLKPSAVQARSMLYLGLVGAVVSLLDLTASSYAVFGPALDLDLRGGWIAPLVKVSKGQNPYIGHLMPDGRRVNPPIQPPR